jgi:hypothetical protein
VGKSVITVANWRLVVGRNVDEGPDSIPNSSLTRSLLIHRMCKQNKCIKAPNFLGAFMVENYLR